MNRGIKNTYRSKLKGGTMSDRCLLKLGMIAIQILLFTIHGFAETYEVNNVTQLENAINQANSAAEPTTILLSEGTYTLNNLLFITGNDITIKSNSGNRENTIIQGDRMASDASVSHIFLVRGNHFELSDLTLQKSRYHIIQVQGEHGASNIKLINCILRDSYEQLFKVSTDPNDPDIKSRNGIIEGCLFEYSAGVGPQWYIGGVDAHHASGWIIRNNIFRDIISPGTAISEFAVHFWSNSENNIVENNQILNCDRGIGFGLNDSGNIGGIIRNNMIYHAIDKGNFADVGIALASSPGSQVYNNTVYLEHDFPWGIEYRFASTTNVYIANNLSNKPIMVRDGASGLVENNVTNAADSWFIDVSSGDLHLQDAIPAVVDQGIAINGLTTDFDGDLRPIGNGIDIGADEFLQQTIPLAPRNLKVIDKL
jgi:hypothetical protein